VQVVGADDTDCTQPEMPPARLTDRRDALRRVLDRSLREACPDVIEQGCRASV